MIKQPVVEKFESSTVAHVGPFSELDQYVVKHPKLGPISGKIWLKEFLGLNGMEVSFGSLPPGASIPFQHAHQQNEELYLFLSGKGEMLIDGKIIKVQEGSAVRVSPAAYRCWRNTGTEELLHAVIQAKEESLEQWTKTDGIPSSEPPKWP